MADQTRSNTMPLQSFSTDAPQTILRRFERHIALDQQGNEASEGGSRKYMNHIQKVHGMLEEEEASLIRLKSQLEKILRQSETELTELQRLRHLEVSLTDKLGQLTKLKSSIQVTEDSSDNAAAKRFRELTAAYKNTFGLRITRTKRPNTIQILLSGCCEEDFNTLSCIILRVNSDLTHMELVKCNPAVPNIEDIISNFNIHGDLRSFIVVLRAKFVRYFQLRAKRQRRDQS